MRNLQRNSPTGPFFLLWLLIPFIPLSLPPPTFILPPYPQDWSHPPLAPPHCLLFPLSSLPALSSFSNSPTFINILPVNPHNSAHPPPLAILFAHPPLSSLLCLPTPSPFSPSTLSSPFACPPTLSSPYFYSPLSL